MSQEEIAACVLHSGKNAAATRNQVYELRQKLRDAGCGDLIVTVRGRGYRLLGTPAEVAGPGSRGSA